MDTSILLDYEEVADGGFFVRAVLLIEGSLGHEGAERVRERRRHGAAMAGSGEGSGRLAARNVHVAVRPGQHAEFIQMTHGFSSAGTGRLLTILVGDVHARDRIRIRMHALVGGAPGAEGEIDVAQLAVMNHRDGTRGEVELETVSFPIVLSGDRRGRVQPDVGTMPVARDLRVRRSSRRPGIPLDEPPPRPT
ncbi:MAG: hypothetical protein R3304_07675 [Longimicrobiales bacterium]|nr:hypothetical protein [Longimicrobiales bacterium]